MTKQQIARQVIDIINNYNCVDNYTIRYNGDGDDESVREHSECNQLAQYYKYIIITIYDDVEFNNNVWNELINTQFYPDEDENSVYMFDHIEYKETNNGYRLEIILKIDE